MEQLRIISTGLAVPGLITNQNMVDMLPDLKITLDWLDKNVGIKQRHVSIAGMQPNDPGHNGDPLQRRPVFKNRTNLKAAAGCCNSDLCAQAIRDAVANCPSANLKLTDIDMIIVSTVTPDMPCPATSTFVMEKLGLNGIKVLDIRSACCGFTTGLQTACAQLVSRLGNVKTVAVVGCEVGSVFGNLDPSHPSFSRGDAANCAMIGDAAACTIVRRFDCAVGSKNSCMQGGGGGEREEGEEEEELPYGPEILHVDVRCIGNGKEPGMHIPCGGCVHPFSQEVYNTGGHFFAHDFKKVLQHGAELYHGAIINGLAALSGKDAGNSFAGQRFAQLRTGAVVSPVSPSPPSSPSSDSADHQQQRQQSYPSALLPLCTATLDDIDLYIPHQANGRISSYAKKMGIDENKIHSHFDMYGNTANASLALGLHLENKKNVLKEGALVMCLAAESTKWLHGTIVVAWHPLTTEAYAARNNKFIIAEGGGGNSAFSGGGLARQWRRYKKAVWFMFVGWMLWFVGFFGSAMSVVAQLTRIGNNSDSQHGQHGKKKNKQSALAAGDEQVKSD